MTDKEALLALNAVPGIGNKAILRLIYSVVDIPSIWSQRKKAYEILSQKQADKINEFNVDAFLEQELRFIKNHNVSVVTIFDSDYPELLREIPDAPIVLYVKGRLPTHNRNIAIVGSRNSSMYGLQTASEFGCQLSEAGFSIISGLARGIDTAAHRGALKGGGNTVAVLGSGLADIYPPDNDALYHEIAQKEAVISEFPMTMAPYPYNFPRRNRIISGLSRGVIVVQAMRNSGALITADFALEQGREVYAVPGPVNHPASEGVNGLLKQGAKVMTRIDDVIEDFKQFEVGAMLEKKKEDLDLSEEEKKVLSHISKDPIHIDSLAGELGISVYNTLFQLELKKAVKQLPGKQYVR